MSDKDIKAGIKALGDISNKYISSDVVPAKRAGKNPEWIVGYNKDEIDWQADNPGKKLLINLINSANMHFFGEISDITFAVSDQGSNTITGKDSENKGNCNKFLGYARSQIKKNDYVSIYYFLALDTINAVDEAKKAALKSIEEAQSKQSNDEELDSATIEKAKYAAKTVKENIINNSQNKKSYGFFMKLDFENVENQFKDNEDIYKLYINRFNKLKDEVSLSGLDSYGIKCEWKNAYKVENANNEETFPVLFIEIGLDNSLYCELIDKMICGLYILNSFYKYVLSGEDSLLESIKFEIDALKNTGDNGVALNPTVLSLNNLIYDDCKQIVLTGAPGTGKTYSAQEYIKWQLMTEYITNKEGKVDAFNDEWDKSENSEGKLADRWRMVQFHPSFDYTDFVEGLRPIEIDKGMQFKRMDGIFKEFCRKVAAENGNKDPKVCPKRFFLIDEINRADLSKVFGELMFCLEEDYRGKSHTIKTQYSNLDTYSKEGTRIKDDPNAGDVFENGFYIPENVIIIGTMNDIDRSVDTFDFALRRRFRWVNVEVNETLLTTTFLAMKNKNDSTKTEEEISGFVKSVMDMNSVFSEDQFKRIFKTPKDYYVGPAYFKGLFKNDTKDAIWRNKIEPLLREYVRGRDKADVFINTCESKYLGKKIGNVSADVQELLDGFVDDSKAMAFTNLDENDKEALKDAICKIVSATDNKFFTRANKNRSGNLMKCLVKEKNLFDWVKNKNSEELFNCILKCDSLGKYMIEDEKENYKTSIINALANDSSISGEEAGE